MIPIAIFFLSRNGIPRRGDVLNVVTQTRAHQSAYSLRPKRRNNAGGPTTPVIPPDIVDVVLHSYRHRFGGISGDPALEGIEAQLVGQPNITVPGIVLLGGDDGVDPPTTFDDDRPHFTGRYERRVVAGAGHNLPQEKPDAFVDAVLTLS